MSHVWGKVKFELIDSNWNYNQGFRFNTFVMSTKEYVEEIKKLSLEEKVFILNSIQENIIEETGQEAVDPAVMGLLIQRQADLKSGKVGSRNWNDIKKELLQ
jgi:hypothetical protein